MFHARGLLFAVPFVVACSSKWSFEDGDGDGVSPAEGDCWDQVEGPEGTGLKGSDIGPNAVETWYDGFDQNCNGDDDYDADGDGFVPTEFVGLGTAGVEGSGYLPGGDCWDASEGPEEAALGGAEIYPGAPDAWYDGLDSNCAGDDDFDQDGDGFASQAYAGEYRPTVLAEGPTLATTDCEDAEALEGQRDGVAVVVSAEDINPGAEEVWYDGIDQDCGGENDFDQDGDGQDSSAHPDASGAFGTDCFDGDIDDVLPMEPRLEDVFVFLEMSNDEVLDRLGLSAADIYSGAPDALYDALDADCGGVEGQDCDGDGDGFQSTASGPPTCADWSPDAEDGRDVELYQGLCQTALCENDDCDDEDATAYPDPSVPEIFYNGIDEDCDFSTGDGDADGDGFWALDYDSRVPDSPLSPGVGEGGDCNDDNAAQNPHPDTVEIWYDGIDQDCGRDDDFDQDGDNYVPTEYEDAITWYVLGLVEAEIDEPRLGGNDCDDTDSRVNPAPSTNEDCATPYDDDCDTDTNDADAEDCTPHFADRDGDGWGKIGDSTCYCEPRDEYVIEKAEGEDGRDCDDESATTFPGAASIDSGSECMKDDDGDDYGDLAPPPGVAAGTDCDDTRAAVNPAPTTNEDCATDYDDDCDGDTNDRDADNGTTFYADVDDDDFGDPGDPRVYCEPLGVYNELDSDDCNDDDPLVNPSVNENCDTSYDDDCDGDTNDRDPDNSTTYFADVDEDGFGDPDDSREYCAPSGVYNELDSDDCDDSRAGVNPSVNEDCLTSYDDDCDGDTNDRDPDNSTTYFADVDEDGFGDPGDSREYCDPLGIYNELDSDDCNDDDPLVNPSVNENCDTTYDDDCDGDTNDRDSDNATTYYADVDEDGFGDPGDPRLYCAPSGVYNELDADDCDDTRASVNPDALEDCSTPYDDDCDGDTNDRDAESSLIFYADRDGDGYGDPDDGRAYCAPRGVFSELDSDDCDDGRSAVNPAASETCATSYDDDCDGDTNDLGALGGTTFYADVDDDGFGDPDDPRVYCVALGVYDQTNNDDCDDTRAAVSPAGTETCSTPYDDDCDGDNNDEGAVGALVWYADVDGDGYGNPGDSRLYCEAEGIYNESDNLDCDDADPTIYTGATESCDLIDSDCDGSLVDGGVSDIDDDGLPDCADDDADGDGYTSPTDCDDTRAGVNPAATETCATSYDDDCDGDENDEGATGSTRWYADRDGDDFGDPADSKFYCDPRGVYNEADNLDCDDDDPTIYTGAPESCDLIDSDCDGSLLDDGVSDIDDDGLPDCADDDADGDGYTSSADCDDTRSSVNPGATETCATAYDDDCDGDDNDEGATGSSRWYADRDEDDYGDATDSKFYCDPKGVYNEADDDDCDDDDATVYPGAAEECDLIDSDCDGSLTDDRVDDTDRDGIPDCVDDDADGDGYTTDVDCDDTDEDINPGASDTDSTEGVDDDCDGYIDEDSVVTELSSGAVLIFTEAQVNPHSGSETEQSREWFEVTNVSGLNLYLDGWTFENCNPSTSSCVSFQVEPGSGVVAGPGDVLLFCFSGAAMDEILGAGSCDYSYGTSPGVSAPYVASTFRLRNTGSNAFSTSVAGVAVDSVDVSEDGFPSTEDANEGYSLMLNGSTISASDPDLANDDGANWTVTSDSTYSYEEVDGEHNQGTPGVTNPTVP